MADEDGDIYSLAVACHDILRDFQAQTSTHIQTNFQRLLESLYHRLNAWGNYLGAFAVESASLDRRLQNASSVKELIVQNLAQLHNNLQLLVEKPPDTKAGRTRLDTEWLSSDHVETQHLVYESAEKVIDRLERLGQTIRRSSTAGLQRRVERFAEKKANTSIGELSILVVQSMYPDAPPSLINFLGRTIFLTYTRLKYKRVHQKKLQVHRPRVPDLEVGPLENVPEPVEIIEEAVQPITRPDAVGGIDTEEHNQMMEHIDSTPGTPEELSGTDPSTLNNLSQNPPTSSAASSIMLSGVHYPKPPKEEFARGWKTCEWCFDNYQTSQFDDTRWWRRHVQHDLVPFVCIFEDCISSAQHFGNFEQWKNHMNDHSSKWAETVHAMVWICDIDHAEPELFRSHESAERHMHQEHCDMFTDAQISAIVKRNVVHRSRKVGECPICSFDIQKDDKATARGFSEIDIADEDVSVPILEQSSKNQEFKGKRVRFDASPPQSPSEPASDIDFAGINDYELFWHKPSEAELRNRTAKHVAEHLQSLAFFALRLLLLDERQIDSSSSEDDMASNKILSNSTDTGVDSRSNLSDGLDEWCGIATFGAADFDISFSLKDDEDLWKIKPDGFSSISTANATIDPSIAEEENIPQLDTPPRHENEADWESPCWHEDYQLYYRRRRDKSQPDGFSYEWLGPEIPDHLQNQVVDVDIDSPHPHDHDTAMDQEHTDKGKGPANATNFTNTYAASSIDVFEDIYDSTVPREDIYRESQLVALRQAGPSNAGEEASVPVLDVPLLGGSSEKTTPIVPRPVDRYRVEHSSKWRIGEVIKCLHAEPRGGQNHEQPLTEKTERHPPDSLERFYVGPRRFIIVKTGNGRSTCVPISTYSGHGLKKSRIRPETHSIVHSSHSKPQILDGEPRPGYPPIPVDMIDDETLDMMSRVDYSNLKTIEHDVPVIFIGSIPKRAQSIITQAVNDVWEEEMPPARSSKTKPKKRR